ncbi:hypothetical protein SAMD00024442_6_24 [Candidatus Symbiothrix dinenymphae]|nr:hypothetical protein SAMD00024442_6_24 [Candidatus Symbiothrix dinenymphae]
MDTNANKITPEEIKIILDTPDEQIDIDAAALLLLKINRNRILHQNIVRRRDIAKLKYELQKHYNFRSAEQAAAEHAALEQKAAVILKTTLPKIEKIEKSASAGKRADHDELPDEIKAKLLENQNIYPMMRKLHEQLKLLKMPCDRYGFLKELTKLDETVRKNWDEYDAFVPGLQPDAPAVPAPSDAPTPASAKEISAARKYLSDNKKKLQGMTVGEEDEESKQQYAALLADMQTRLDLLIGSNAGISDRQLAELKALGLDAQ